MTEPADGMEAAAPEPEPDPTPRCEVCGAELDADQTYCLECGTPTPLAPGLRRRGRELALLAGALAILGIGAGALAFAVAADDGDGPAATASTLTATALATAPTVPPPVSSVPTIGTLPADPTVTTPPPPLTTSTATGFQTVTGPSTAPDPGTTTEDTTTEDTVGEAPEPTDPGLSSGSDWPAGRTAWTAILSSVRDESDARAARTRVRASGEPAGVLYSSDHSELNPGFWVVFSGTFASRTTAIAQAGKLRPDFPGAYAREISG